MELAFSSTENNPAIRAFIEDQAIAPAQFNPNIHADDEMLLFLLDAYPENRERALLSYFKSGQEVMDRVRQIINWRFQGFENVSAFLDFACGYGRFTRFLVQELSPEKIWVSDIYTHAVQFQQQQFGVRGIDSATHPDDFHCEQKFDCILVASLFSHLPEKTFVAWLKKLLSLLTPDGLLLFSVHDQAILPSDYTMPASGICFAEASESQSLDTQEYGSTWVTEAFVSSAIARATDAKPNYYRIKKGLWQQDLYLVNRNPQREFTNLTIKGTPRGWLSHCFLTENQQLELKGWAVDISPGEYIRDIQILINGELKQQCLPFVDRPDVSEFIGYDRVVKAGWSCIVQLEPTVNLATDILMVKVISSSGIERIIHVSTLTSALSEPVPQPQAIAQPQDYPITWKNRLLAALRNTREWLTFSRDERQLKGCLESANLKQDSELVLSGWAVDVTDRLEEIQILINDRLNQKCKPFIPRPDVAQVLGNERFIVAGWSCSCNLAANSNIQRDDLTVKAVSSNNCERVLYTGTIEAALKALLMVRG